MNSSHRFQLLRRIPIPVLSVMIGVLCGVLVWAVLDQVQPKALRDIFTQELRSRLDQQARETLFRFENFVTDHISTTRLLANHRLLSSYLEPIYWYQEEVSEPIVYFETPPWLPEEALWQTLVQPSHILLVDNRGRAQEIYQVGKQPLPKELDGVNDLFLNDFLGENRVQAYLTMVGSNPYLLVSETAEDATGTYMGSLVFLVPIDVAFLLGSQRGTPVEEVVVGILDADEQRFIVSSDPFAVPSGIHTDEIAEQYVVTTQSFFDYEGTDINMQFTTMMPLSSVEATLERVAGVERRQRVVAAITFVTVFTFVFYLLSARLNRILRRISHFSRRALGGAQPVVGEGNEIFVLEDWIRQFINRVRVARDEMRQKHESEMQESESLTQAILETALDAIITIDETGHIVELNTTAERTLGFSREIAIGQLLEVLVLDQASMPHFVDLLRHAVLVPEDQGDVIRGEMQATRADGTLFPVEVSIKRIQLSNSLFFTVYLHDITDRRRAERAIVSLAKFPAESPSPVLRVNRPGVIIYANTASDPLLEYWDCLRGQTLPQYWRGRIVEVLDSRRNWETEVSSSGRVYSLMLAPVIELDYVNIYGRDITEVRQAEGNAREHQQELIHVSRLSTMGEMATGLAHELNQPLAAITNYASGCSRRLRPGVPVGDDILSALQQISNQADRAGDIIRRLRSLVGKQPQIRTRADANDLVREVCSFVEFDARKREVVIEQHFAVNPLWVEVDVVQIEQVLLNLIRNGLDALSDVEAGRRSLVVSLDRRANHQVDIAVIDSGPGIEPEVMLHLFEPFYTTKRSGMGMGLVISETIVDDHGGKIGVRNMEQGGARFVVSLPAVSDGGRG
ncbi:MAG: PAS domain S-box protein [Gammaproteobacteria bacterium]|nr:PAS domain S-box protein [Gammaproteobacteria bacterium]